MSFGACYDRGLNGEASLEDKRTVKMMNCALYRGIDFVISMITVLFTLV